MSARGGIGVAVFGAGRMGNVHFRHAVLNEHAILRWVLEVDVPRAEAMVRAYQLESSVNVCAINEADRVFQDPQVDLILVCTPAQSHHEIVTKALTAGKAVFCEKPLAPTVDGIKECYALAEQKGKHLFCAFNRRYDPQIRNLYNKVRAGDLGKPRVVKTCSRDPPGMNSPDYIRTSGGIFLDSCVHDIDMVCWLVGEKPISVYATGHATDPMFADNGDIDTCVIVLRYPGGAVGIIDVSRNAHLGYDQRIEVQGTLGDGFSGNLRHQSLMTTSNGGDVIQPIYGDTTLRYAEAYKAELEYFIRILKDNGSLEMEGDAIINGTIIAHACKESLDSGKVIPLKDKLV